MRLTRADEVAQDARHTTGEWLTWALDAVADPRAEFESTIREMVSEKIKSTREGADELLRDVAGSDLTSGAAADPAADSIAGDWNSTDRAA